jgi:hypothetical protein
MDVYLTLDLRECLNLTQIYIERIFGWIFASCGGSDAGIVTDKTWRKAPKKTSRYI